MKNFKNLFLVVLIATFLFISFTCKGERSEKEITGLISVNHHPVTEIWKGQIFRELDVWEFGPSTHQRCGFIQVKSSRGDTRPFKVTVLVQGINLPVHVSFAKSEEIYFFEAYGSSAGFPVPSSPSRFSAWGIFVPKVLAEEKIESGEWILKNQ